MVAISYQFFKWLGAQWMEGKFGERLQALRHEQNKEIEQLKFEISKLLDKTTKLNQREFDALPEAWSILNDAFWNVRAFVSPLQSYPDLNRMSAAQLDEFLNGCRLSGWQKDDLRNERDKTKYYQKAIFWHHFEDADRAAREAHRFTLRNGIFFDDDVLKQLVAMNDKIWNALIEHRLNVEHEIHPPGRDAIKLLMEADGEIQALQTMIKERLRPIAYSEGAGSTHD